MMDENQIFQDGVFIIHGLDKILWICIKQPKADATDAITLLESENNSYSLSGVTP